MALIYAVNLAGYKYDYKGSKAEWDDHEERETFFMLANGLHNTSTKNVKDVGRDAYLKNAKRPSSVPHKKEKETNTTAQKVLWVGMRPTTAAKYTSVGDGKGHAVGADNTRSDRIVSYDENALRVVVPFGKTNVNYFALIDPAESMLCEGLIIDKTEVFFFEEYRDDITATSTTKRNLYTSACIKALVEPKTKAKVAVIDHTIAQKPELHGVHNEITALVSSYLVGGDPVILDRPKMLLEKILGGPERNNAFSLFLSGRKIGDQAEAEELIKDVEQTWTALTKLNMTAKEIEKLSIYMDQLGINVQPRYGRAFIVSAIRLLRCQAKQGVLEGLPGLLEDVHMQIGEAIYTEAPQDVDSIRQLLTSIIEELEAIHQQYLADMESMKKFHGGSQLTADSLEVVMARLAVTPDLDTARLNVGQMFRLTVEQVIAAGTKTPQRLLEFTQSLRLCADNLNDEEDPESS